MKKNIRITFKWFWLLILSFVFLFPAFFLIALTWNHYHDKFTRENLKIEGKPSRYYKVNHKIYYLEANGLGVRRLYIDNVDTETFKVLEPKLGQDKNFVYSKNTVIDGADSATFKIIRDEVRQINLYSDDEAVYLRHHYWPYWTRFNGIGFDWVRSAGVIYVRDKKIYQKDTDKQLWPYVGNKANGDIFNSDELNPKTLEAALKPENRVCPAPEKTVGGWLVYDFVDESCEPEFLTNEAFRSYGTVPYVGDGEPKTQNLEKESLDMLFERVDGPAGPGAIYYEAKPDWPPSKLEKEILDILEKNNLPVSDNYQS